MDGVRVLDLLRLVAATDDPHDHLRKLFEWQIERAMTSVRIMATAVGAVLIALFAAVFKDGSSQVPHEAVAAVVIASLLGLAYAWSRYEVARTLEREYVVALNLIRELQPLSPMLQLATDLYDD